MGSQDRTWTVSEVSRRKLRNVKYESLGYEMDVRDLKFDDESFDVAIDKGTMDAMMTAKGDIWVCKTRNMHCDEIDSST